MTTRAILAEDHTTIAFDCPKCKLRSKVGLEKIGHTYHCQVKCSCGNIFSAEIEFRERTRKQLDIPGSYEIVGQETTAPAPPEPNSCRIIDLSRTGLAFLKNAGREVKAGEIVRVNFRLDDAEATEIVQDCEVRHVKENFVGCRLLTENAALEYYLLG
jgi:hypothetical protein